METTKIKRIATTLAIIGGATSAVCGGVIWFPYVVTGVCYGFVPPLAGFLSFILGILVILGGIFINRGRVGVGTNLAIWCGVAIMFSGGFSATAQTLFILAGPIDGRSPIAGTITMVAGITLVLVFPVLAGVLGLMSRES